LNTISKVDEEFLISLASETGGRFFRAEALFDLDASFSEIASTTEEVVVNISLYLLLAAVGLFTFNWILHNLRFKTVP
jgi:hypothetical protein